MRNPHLQKPSTAQRRGTATPVTSLIKPKVLKNGKRVLLSGIAQMKKAKGDTYSIHGLARKLGIPTNRVRDAVFRGEISAQGTRSGTRTRWDIPWGQAHRMAKIVEADHDRLWKNGKRTTQLLKAMSAHADLSKYWMRPTLLPWIDRLLRCRRGTIAVGLRLRILAGMTMLDISKKIEERFVVTVHELAVICRISEPSVKVALRELRKANLIESTKRGRAASVFRVLDASPSPPEKTSKLAKPKR